MKVFISWSGELSKNLAEAFKQWLPGVLQVVKPYYSPDDISKGSRWANEISKELDASKICIICLTQENLEAPWIMFEAGVISKNLDKSKVCPILFNVEPTDIQGPLIPFQAAKFSKEEIKKVIKMMNSELGDGGLAMDVLESVFEMWWPKLKENIDRTLKEVPAEKKKSLRTERDILEEILKLSRAVAMTRDNSFGENTTTVHPAAIKDFVKSFEMFVQEIEILSGRIDVSVLYDALKTFERPLNYLISTSSNLSLKEKEFHVNRFEMSLSRLVEFYHEASEEEIVTLKRPRKRISPSPNKTN